MAYALFLSLLAHVAVFSLAAPAQNQSPTRGHPIQRFDARLRTASPPRVETLSHSVSTTPSAAPTLTEPPPTPGSRARTGQNLRQQAMFALTRHLYYPTAAVSAGLEGEAILLLRIDANGRVVEAQLARSSGHVLLDEAALDAGNRIEGLTPGPREMLLPIDFRLN